MMTDGLWELWNWKINTSKLIPYQWENFNGQLQLGSTSKGGRGHTLGGGRGHTLGGRGHTWGGGDIHWGEGTYIGGRGHTLGGGGNVLGMGGLVNLVVWKVGIVMTVSDLHSENFQVSDRYRKKWALFLVSWKNDLEFFVDGTSNIFQHLWALWIVLVSVEWT